MPNQNSFLYKDRFFELPYLVNSPQAMIESYKKMPFIKSDDARQSISAKMPVLNIEVHYRTVEEGLYLIYSEVKFRANVRFRPADDVSKPADYYCLSLRIDHYAKVINSMANDISYADNSWLLFKPGAKVNHFHFKGTTGKYFTVYFTADWLQEYMKQLSEGDRELLDLFLQSESDHLICPNLPGNKIYNTDALCNELSTGQSTECAYVNRLKEETRSLISFFISKMRSECINARHFKVSNLERIKILKAEQIMREYTCKKFPGISVIAKETGLPQTKLKECFKTVYNKTVFQYFQDLQMTKARELILQTDMPIAQVASNFCYEDPGKFAAAFKAHHSILPSEMK